LPAIANKLPTNYGEFLKNKITRIAITRILFALGHTLAFDQQMGVMPQLIGGLINGILLEANQSILSVGLAHSFAKFESRFYYINY
jgi:hypothetical protein